MRTTLQYQTDSRRFGVEIFQAAFVRAGRTRGKPELLAEISLAANFLIVKGALEMMTLELVGLLTSCLYINLQINNLQCACVTNKFQPCRLTGF